MEYLTTAERKALNIQGRTQTMNECVELFPANAEWHRERIAEIEAMTDAEYEAWEAERWAKVGLPSPSVQPIKKAA